MSKASQDKGCNEIDRQSKPIKTAEGPTVADFVRATKIVKTGLDTSGAQLYGEPLGMFVRLVAERGLSEDDVIALSLLLARPITYPKAVEIAEKVLLEDAKTLDPQAFHNFASVVAKRGLSEGEVRTLLRASAAPAASKDEGYLLSHEQWFEIYNVQQALEAISSLASLGTDNEQIGMKSEALCALSTILSSGIERVIYQIQRA
jgi:hypothetical protein